MVNLVTMTAVASNTTTALERKTWEGFAHETVQLWRHWKLW